MPLQLLTAEDLAVYRNLQYSEEATRPGVEAEASAEHSEPAGIVPGHQPNGQRRES